MPKHGNKQASLSDHIPTAAKCNKSRISFAWLDKHPKKSRKTSLNAMPYTVSES